MNFSSDLDKLQQHVSDTKSAAQAAATESREKLEHRIDQTRRDIDAAAKEAKQQAEQASTEARTNWAQMKVDVAGRVGNVKARMDRQASEMDARAAATAADWAEADARDAIDFAGTAVDNARLTILEAIAARAQADEAKQALAKS